jgi:hypothetical protein
MRAKMSAVPPPRPINTSFLKINICTVFNQVFYTFKVLIHYTLDQIFSFLDKKLTCTAKKQQYNSKSLSSLIPPSQELAAGSVISLIERWKLF